MMAVLDGKKIAGEIKSKLKEQFQIIKRQHPDKPPPRLGSIIIGEDPSIHMYIASQKRLCDEFKIEYILRKEPKNTSIDKIAQIIYELKMKAVTGIIANLPLPKNIKHQDVIAHIGVEKDVEALHPENMGRIFSGDFSISPCTPAAVMQILAQTKVKLYGKEALVIGSSRIVGKPLSIMLLNKFVTVTVCHIATKKNRLKEYIENTDILVTAVGAKAFKINGNWIKKGAIVIDIATKRIKGKITGDVDFETAKKKASYITPVPGGVGPVTNVMLIRNLLELYKRQI